MTSAEADRILGSEGRANADAAANTAPPLPAEAVALLVRLGYRPGQQ